jgi:hypothetical protein
MGMERITVNLTPSIRQETIGNRKYLVVPLTMLVGDSVLNGSQGELFYPKEEVLKSPDDWNGMPLVKNHPTDNTGLEVSARNPYILNKYGLGFVFNSMGTEDGQLVAEGWFDVENTRRIDKRILNWLLNKKPIELSTGLFTRNEPVPEGTKTESGIPYKFGAYDYKPDHLAILPDDTGACSRKDGCGVFVGNQTEKQTRNKQVWTAIALAISSSCNRL